MLYNIILLTSRQYDGPSQRIRPGSFCTYFSRGEIYVKGVPAVVHDEQHTRKCRKLTIYTIDFFPPVPRWVGIRLARSYGVAGQR